MRLLFILLSLLFTLPSFAQEPPIGSQAKADSIEIRDQRATKKFQQAMDKWLITDFARVGLIANTLVKTSPFLQYPAMNPELGAYLATFEQETGTTIILRAYIDIPYFNPWVVAYRSSQKTRKAFEISKAKPAHAVIDIVYSPSGMKSKYEVAGYNITVRDSLRTPAFREIFSEADFTRMRDTLQAAMGKGPVQTIDSTRFNTAVIRALEALKGDTKTKPDPGYKVTFRKGHAKGYDAYKYPVLRKYYRTDDAGNPVPWLSASTLDALTLQGRYEIKDLEAAKETPINIEVADLTTGAPQVEDTTLTQALRPAGEAREVDITANYFRTNRFSTGVETIAGQAALAVYEEKEVSLVVVLPADNRNNTPKVDAEKLESYLDEVYRPALVNWKVRTETLDYDYPTSLEVNSGQAKYSAGMNAMIKAFKKQKGVESKTCYVILVPGLSGGATTGFMPFKGQFAFVAPSKDIDHTIAHELGHGPFRLRHTFSQGDYVAGQGATDNLMDYTEGKTRLYKHQWDLVHDPETMLFPGMEDAEETENWTYEELTKAFCNPDKISISFLSPAGSIISLPYSKLKNYTFTYGATSSSIFDEEQKLISFDNLYFNQSFMTGTLSGFSLENEDKSLSKYIFIDGDYINKSNTSDVFIPQDNTQADGFVYPVICGNKRIYYKFPVNAIPMYKRGERKKDFTHILPLFTPFYENNQPMIAAGVELKQEVEFSPNDNCFYCANSNTVQMTRDHCGSPEYIWIDKLAQMRVAYPNIFEQFTQVDYRPANNAYTFASDVKDQPNWMMPIDIHYKTISVNGATVTPEDGIFTYTSWPWGKHLSDHSWIKERFESDKIGFFNEFYKEFTNYIGKAVSSSTNFWDLLSESTPRNDIMTQIEKEDRLLLRQLAPAKKMLALRKIVEIEGNLKEIGEDRFLKLLASFKPQDYEQVLDYLSNNVGLKTLYEKFDNVGGKPNLTCLMLLIGKMVVDSNQIIQDNSDEMMKIIDNTDLIPKLEGDMLSWANFTWSFVGKNDINIEGYGTVPYNQIISVCIAHRFNVDGTEYPKGLVTQMPAIQAVILSHVNTVEVREKLAWIAVDVGLMFVGIGELQIAFTAGGLLRKAFIISDMVGSSVGITVQLLSNDAISDDLRIKVQLASALLSLPNAVSSISSVKKVIRNLDEELAKESNNVRKANIEKIKNGLKSKAARKGVDLGLTGRIEDLLVNSYPALLKKLKEAKLEFEFYEDFADTSEDILRAAQNENTGLLEGWMKFRRQNPTKIVKCKS